MPPTTNKMAIAALVCSLFFAPLGIVFGHVSLSQIKRSGENGREMAVAGLVVGYLLTVLSIIAVVGIVLLLIVLGPRLQTF